MDTREPAEPTADTATETRLYQRQLARAVLDDLGAAAVVAAGLMLATLVLLALVTKSFPVMWLAVVVPLLGTGFYLMWRVDKLP